MPLYSFVIFYVKKNRLKKLNLLSVHSKLRSIAIGTFAVWVFIGITLYENIQSIREYDDLTTTFNTFSINIINLRKAENNFLLIEQNNSYFYTTGRSKYLEKFKIQYDRCIDNINELNANSITQNFQLNEKLNDIKQNLKEYSKNVNLLVKNIRERGYLDYGLVGEMNTAAEQIENQLSDNNPKHNMLNENKNIFKEKILVLRQYEKDFLSLKDMLYYENFFSTVKTYKKFFKNIPTTLKKEDIADFFKILQLYKEKFKAVAEKEQKIGLTIDDGLHGAKQTLINRVEKDVENMLSLFKQKNSMAIERITFWLFLIVFLMAITLVGLLILISKSITTPIKKIKNYIHELVKGKFPASIKFSNQDEIAEMADLLNAFVENLKEKAIFSEHIGRGNYSAKLKVASNEDTLGFSLKKMRDELKKASEEDKKRKIEDEKNVWATNGLTHFNDILRHNPEKISELGYEVIKNLVDFLNANQGGLFLYNDDNPNDIFLELITSYAYNKKKQKKKKIILGEGLIGTCAIEKSTTYLTDIPDDYINITTGLGMANPNSLLIVPLVLNEQIFGVIELASFSAFQAHEIQFVEKLAENVAGTLSVVRTNDKTRHLLRQFQQQSEDLATKEEEMRQNLEELTSIQESLVLQKKNMTALRFALDESIIYAEFQPDGLVCAMNTKYTEATGYTEKELLGENIAITMHGKTKENFDLMWEKILAGNSYKGILKTRIKSGQEKWFHANYTPIFDENKTIFKIIYLGQDITELKRLELEQYDREAAMEIKMKRLETEINILKKELEIKSQKKNPINPPEEF